MAEELFDESHYFMCSGGLKPCSFNAGQEIMKKETDEYYLIEQSLTTRNGDFSCRWMALLVAILAALIAVLCATGVGAVLVAAMIGAAAGAGGGMLFCGSKAAVARTWLVIKADAQIGTKKMVVNQPGEHLKCAAFGQPIIFLPNVTSEFHAMVLFAGNVGMKGLEGFMYAYATRGVGMLVTKPLTFFANFGVNLLKSYTLKGIGFRAAFGAWSGISAYSTSSKEMTVTEGLQNKELWKEAGKTFGFAETAAYRLATQDYTPEQKAAGNEIIPKMYDDEGNEVYEGLSVPAWTSDAALLLSLGGIPGGQKIGTDNFGFDKFADATKFDLKGAAKPIAGRVGSALDAAKKFREGLRNQKKGTGAHESMKRQTKLNSSGEIIMTVREVKAYIKQMNDLGVKVKYDTKGQILGKKTQAAFDNQNGIIYLEKPIILYDAMHEGFHAKQWSEIGKESYNKQTRLQKEQYVYDQLMKNKNVLTPKQINHADAYIYSVEKGYWPIYDKGTGMYIF